MLIKLLIALIITITMLSYTGGFSSHTMKNSVNDHTITTNSTILDNAIVAYYCNHHGALPDKLDADTLIVMGMEDIDLSKFTYTKISNRQFRLVSKLSNGKTSISAHSNIDLVVPPEVN